MNRFIVLFAALAVSFQGHAQMQEGRASAPGATRPTLRNPATPPPNANLPGTKRWRILENDRVVVDARTYGPGQRTDWPGQFHTECYDVVTLMLTPGHVEMNATGEMVETGYFHAGHAWWWPKSPPGGHSIANVGTTPFTYLNIRLKEKSLCAPGAATPQPVVAGRAPVLTWAGPLKLTDPKGPRPNANLPGTRRWNILQNDRMILDAREYAPGQRTDWPGEYHNECYDVVTLMLTPGWVEMNAAGDKVEVGYFEAGHAWWWPKSPPGGHSIANVGTSPFTYLNFRLKENNICQPPAAQR